MAGGNREPGRTVTSKVIAVLGAFEHTMHPLDVTEIAELASLHPSTTHRLVTELTEGGLLSKKSDRQYQLELRIWKLANNTEFGLGGLVFGTDKKQALAVAREVDSGSVGINFFGSNHSAPFGGRHESGMGVEYGIEGLSAYLTYKSIHRTV